MITLSFQDGLIYHPLTDKCITAYRTAEGRTDVHMQKCSSEDMKQRWTFEWLWYLHYIELTKFIFYEEWGIYSVAGSVIFNFTLWVYKLNGQSDWVGVELRGTTSGILWE